MIKNLFIVLLFIFSGFAFGKELTIGCATKCDAFFHYSLHTVARKLGHTVRLVDISQAGPQVQWEKYDGIIMPGGADIDPKYFLPSVETELQELTKSLDHLVIYSAEGRRRDPIEYKLLKEYFADPGLLNLPILGVCRGMQMLAVSQGIPLYVDIKTELGIPNRRYLYDRIQMEDGDTLMNVLFSSTFRAFKRHHQGIRVSYFKQFADRWPQLSISSYSNKGLIAESLEFSNRPVLGVQFHPENDFGFERNRIIGWLLQKAITRSDQRK